MPWTTATTRSTGFLVTAAVWNSEHVDNMNFLKEVNYTQFTADVSITATTDATAQTVVSSGAITYENVPHLIEFFSPWVIPDAGAIGRQLILNLYDGSTDLGRIGQVRTPAAQNSAFTCKLERRLTPTAASHTYIIKAWVSAGTGTVSAGAGGTATPLPGFIRVTRVPT
jgi:hypothetical protein